MGWSVIRYTWEKLQGPLGKGSRNIWGPLPPSVHANTTGHHTRVDNFLVVDGEVHNITGTIREAMYIRVSDPRLASSNCPTHGMRSYLITLPSTSSNTVPNFGAHCTWPTTPHVAKGCRGLQSLSTSYSTGRYVVLHKQVGVKPFGTMCHSSHIQWCHQW